MTNPPPTSSTSGKHSPLERLLNVFAKVHPKEGMTSILLLSNIFLILVTYYLIKPVREGWLSVSFVSGLSKLEVKAYSAFGQSLLLIFILPLYAILASKLTRRTLLTGTAAVSGLLFIVFWLCQPEMIVTQVPYAGILFYMFVGIFSVTLIAQFWSFASDLYGQERGKRLFPLIAVGASSGAMVGSWIGEQLMKSPFIQAFDLILLAIVPLFIAVLLARYCDKRGTTGNLSEAKFPTKIDVAAPEGGGAFGLILQHNYLMAAALTIFTFNWIVASGDNILFGLVQQSLEKTLDSTLSPEDYKRSLKEATTYFYSNLFFWINLVGLLLQAFVVSRLIAIGGFGLLILTTPIVSLGAYLSMAIAPALGIIKVMKIAENSSNYSINNTARHMLWLPTSKEMLYKAKTTVDTLFVRFGDGMAAMTVLLGTRFWHFSLTQFLLINIVLTILWILLAIYLTCEYKKWSKNNKNSAPRQTE